MNDCPNAEMRDLLPDLLHERLSASVRAEVMAHVGGCADCREELELIRTLQVIVTAKAPRVDVAYVVNALPKPPQRNVTPIAARRRSWADWRVAAAVTLIAAGGSSVALLNREPKLSDSVSIAQVAPTPSEVLVTPAAGAQPSAIATTVPTDPSGSTASAALGADARLSDLNDDQLEALIDEIGRMKAVPMAEPDPVLIRVDPRNTSGMEELQ